MTHTCEAAGTADEPSGPLRIGELASIANVSVRSLRYYEQQGLLESERTPGGQRVYGGAAVARVRLIQQLFAAAVPSRVIVDLLPCVASGHATEPMLAQLQHERDAIGIRMHELQQAHDKLEEVIELAIDAGIDVGAPADRLIA